MTTVTISGLRKVYPGQQEAAIAGLDLEIDSGSLTALLGPSGCGKTTLLKMITGLLEPTKGDILFDGESILPLAPEKRNAVMVFQNHLLFPYMTVAENVGFGLRMRGVSKRQIALQVEQTLELVHLGGYGPSRPSQLSGGQQQRVALARALIVKPRLLLLDEPLSNLDAHLRLEMRDFILNLQRETKVTCVLVTHDQEEAVSMSDKLALMLSGELKQYAPPEVFFERPASLEIAKFFGAQNFIPGKHDGSKFSCALGEFVTASKANAASCTAILRPENIKLAREGDQAGLPCEVLAVTYLGTSCRLQVEVAPVVGTEAVRLVASVSGADYRQHKQGGKFALCLDPNDLWIVA